LDNSEISRLIIFFLTNATKYNNTYQKPNWYNSLTIN
jgi:hypothetical protein